MSSKSSISILAKALAEKDGLKQADAENFVTSMFEVVNDALQTDKLVKMRWLGTFKVLSVKDRESVDVNTGERIVIEGRDKISFVPDNILKEIVNKPFAQFETVTVNDGIDFSEIDEKFAKREADGYDVGEEETIPVVDQVAEVEAEALETKEQVKPEVEMEAETEVEREVETVPEDEKVVVVEKVSSDENETESVEVTVGEEESVVEPEQAVVEPEQAETPQVEVPQVQMEAPQVEVSQEETPQQETSQEETPQQETSQVEVLQIEVSQQEASPISSMVEDVQKEDQVKEEPVKQHHIVVPRYLVVVACFLVLALIGGLGWFAFSYGKMAAQRDYLANQRDYLTSQLKTIKHQQTIAKASALPANEDSVQLELKKKAKEDSIRMVKVSETIKEKAANQQVEKKIEEKSRKVEPTVSSSKYDNDARVRTGAYRIVGVAQKVTVKPGQTLGSISKIYLGAGMECYIEALNGTSKVTVGQEIKIPKLELRKKKKE